MVTQRPLEALFMVRIHVGQPIISNENAGSVDVCTEFAQQPARTADRRVRFPVTIRHRASKAKIYAPAGKFAYYRVAYATAGKRRMQTFAAYSDAKAAAERIVRELANGSQAAALTASQSRDALAAFERLDGYFKSKGKRVSLNTAVADYLDAVGRLNVPLSAAVTGYLNTVATVKRVDLAAAVKEFVDGREAETKSVNGKRPELSKSYFLNTKLWLGWFEKTFPATAVCDLTKRASRLVHGRTQPPCRQVQESSSRHGEDVFELVHQERLFAREPPLAGCNWHETAKSRQRRNGFFPPG